MKNTVRKLLIVPVALFSFAMSSSAFALPIVDGVFNLVNDGSKIPYSAGQLIATGSFTTEATVTGNLNGFDIVPLIRLTVIDETPDNGFGNINYTAATAGNFMVPPSAPLLALLDSVSGEFVGLQGTIISYAAHPWLSLVLSGVNANVGDATFVLQNMSTSHGESGFQVPEPSAIALLGIGLLAFGLARKKISKFTREHAQIQGTLT